MIDRRRSFGPSRRDHKAGELQNVVGEEFMRLSEGNVSEFQNVRSFRVSDPKEHIDDPWGVSLSLPGADVMVPQTRESGVSVRRGGVVLHGVAHQNQQVSIVVVSAILAVRWLEAKAGKSEQETAVPTPEQLSNVKMNHNLDLFRTTCKILTIPNAIERTWSRQRLMAWIRAVVTSWMYECRKRHMSRNTEAYQSV